MGATTRPGRLFAGLGKGGRQGFTRDTAKDWLVLASAPTTAMRAAERAPLAAPLTPAP